MKRGHRQSILGSGTRLTTNVSEPRRSVVDQPRWISRPVARPRPEHYQPPPEWRAGPGDPHLKRKWLMHIEDERAGEWKL